MEQAGTGADHNIPLGAETICDAQPWIHASLRVQNPARPGFPIRAHAKVDCEVVGRAPVVLGIESAVGVIERA